MARAGLRDDDMFGVSPIGFVRGYGSVPVGLDTDGGPCGLPPLSPGVKPGPGSNPDIPSAFPRATIRRRIPAGWSDSGNPLYAWQDQATGLETLSVEVREEYDDAAGITTVAGKITVAYGPALPPIMETAVVVMTDGTRWQVTASERLATSTVLTVHRVDMER